MTKARQFADREVTDALAHGGTIAIPPWRLQLPRIFGFCGGVLNAIRMLEQTLAETPGRPGKIWLLGEIIHNETVNRYFQACGVRIPEAPEDPAFLKNLTAGDTVVIPAFGLPLPVENRLRRVCRARRLRIVDTTCCYVQRIWQFVQEQAASGATVLIHGQPEHPETRAILSRACGPANAAILVPDPAAARCLAAALKSRQLATYPRELVIHPKKIAWNRLALVHQTTMLFDEAMKIENQLGRAVSKAGGSFVPADTVCRATQERQNAAFELCRAGCDLLLVIGGFSSSNTTQLYRLAKRFSPVYFIRGAADFSRGSIRHFIPDENRVAVCRGWLKPEIKTIGLLAGASCPARDIGGVIRKFKALRTPLPRVKAAGEKVLRKHAPGINLKIRKTSAPG